jgi:hypothetical protein
MNRECPVCRHSSRQAIEQAWEGNMVGGSGCLGVSYAEVQRHMNSGVCCPLPSKEDTGIREPSPFEFAPVNWDEDLLSEFASLTIND